MASTYSTNLRLELIGTGEQQGTWGTTTNTNLGTLLEEAIGGYVSVTVSDVGDTTLTTANGAVDQARNMTINLTGTISAARNVIVPAIEKIYVVKNSTTGGYAVTVKVSGQTGVSVPNGTTMLVYVDGTDVRQAGVSVGPSGSTVISVTDNSNAALRITQLGTGAAIRVEDETNPDSTPFIVDASGSVGVGTTAPIGKIDVTQSTGFSFFANHTSTDGYSGIGYYENGSNKGYQVHFGSSASGGERLETWTSSASPLTFGTNNTERMRIGANGLVSIGSTGQPGYGSGSGFAVTQTGVFSSGVTGSGDSAYTQRDTAGAYLKFWYGPLGSVPTSPGGITTTGTAVAYNTSSDYRLKEDFQPVSNATQRVMSLHPVNFAWKADGSRVDGFIAHEAQEVVPEAVTGAKDAVDADGNPVYQGIDQSKLVPLLTAALQEALTKIGALEARIAALEAA